MNFLESQLQILTLLPIVPNYNPMEEESKIELCQTNNVELEFPPAHLPKFDHEHINFLQ